MDKANMGRLLVVWGRCFVHQCSRRIGIIKVQVYLQLHCYLNSPPDTHSQLPLSILKPGSSKSAINWGSERTLIFCLTTGASLMSASTVALLSFIAFPVSSLLTPLITFLLVKSSLQEAYYEILLSGNVIDDHN